MTPLVRDIIKLAAIGGVDPTEMHWFDATGCFKDQTERPPNWLLESQPPFPKCMVCWEGNSLNHQRMRLVCMLVGDDPDEGIVVTVWRLPSDHLPVASPIMIYVRDEGMIRYGPVEENVNMDQAEAEMILGFIAAWYESLAQRGEAYVPSIIQNFTNRRKIAQGKVPSYEWRTVVIEPVQPKKEHAGGTHASPRLHDRRGHLRRLRSGKNVWVKQCKVGDASKGIVWHDYELKEKA